MIKRLLKPPRDSGVGYEAAEIDRVLRERLEEMKHFCGSMSIPFQILMPSGMHHHWPQLKHSEQPPGMQECSKVVAEHLFLITMTFHTVYQPHGTRQPFDWDETLVQEIHAHLQGIGKYVWAMDLVDFLDTDEIQACTGHKNRINITTTQRWMK